MKVLVLISFLFINQTYAQTIAVYAGNGSAGLILGDGGPALNGEISVPSGLMLDNSGNLAVCQQGMIRRIDKITKIITTIAGNDTASSVGLGGDGGPATCSFILYPLDVCFAKNGDFYIADHWYSEVRKVTVVTGIIDTFAGDRNPGSTGDGGPAKQAELNAPWDVCFDTSQHYLYISNQYDYRVRRVDMATNIISAFAGTGVPGYSGDGGLADTAKFSRLLGICMDKSNNMYIGDWDNARIRKVDAITGIVTTVVGNGVLGYGGDGGPAYQAMINKSSFMRFDKCGNLFFTDEDNNRVRRVDVNTNIITTIAGNGTAGYIADSGLAKDIEFNHPIGLAIDSEGNIFISDYYNNRVWRTTFPYPYIHVSATSEIVTIGTSITATTTVSGGGDAPQYQWYVDGMPVSGATNSSYTYTPANGDSVWCVLTSNSQCVGTPTATSNMLHILTAPAGVSQVVASHIILAPNPALNTITITAPVTITDITVIDLLGREVFSRQYNSDNVDVEISELPGGVYFVKVNDVYAQKLIKK